MKRLHLLLIALLIASNAIAQDQPPSFTSSSTITFPSSRCYILLDTTTSSIIKILDRTQPTYTNIEIRSEVCDNLILYYDKELSKYGFIDISGEIKIKPSFKEARPFSYGNAAVYVRDTTGIYSWRFINTDGKYISTQSFYEVNDFIGDYAIVIDSTTKKYGLIRTDGVLTVPMTYDKLNSLSDEAVSFYDSKIKLWGYISTNNKLMIPAQYQDARSFFDGKAFVQNYATKTLGFIDTSGKFIIKLPYSVYDSMLGYDASYNPRFSDGLCAMFDSTERMWGFINTSGEWVIEPIYFSVTAFKAGVAQVAKSNADQVTFIDTEGNRINIGDPRLSSYIYYDEETYSISFGDGRIVAKCYPSSIVSRPIYGRYSVVHGLRSSTIIIDYNNDR